MCVTSRPPPGTEIEVEWLKNGEALRNLKRYRIEEVEAGSLLTILDVRVTDEATYSCTASNRIGEVESIDFNLILSSLVFVHFPLSLRISSLVFVLFPLSLRISSLVFVPFPLSLSPYFQFSFCSFSSLSVFPV